MLGVQTQNYTNMKKTIIALLALGSVAMAESVDSTLTTGIKVIYQGEETFVSALNEDATNFVGGSALNAIHVGSSFANWSGSRNVASLQFEVTVAELYGAELLQVADSITLNSFSYLGNADGWCEDEGRTITVATGTQSKTVLLDAAGVREGAWLTVSDLDFELTKDSVLTITLSPSSSMVTDNMSLATADIYGKSGATVTWSGVTTEKDDPSLGMNSNWSYEAPLVKLSVTTTPEPATATLSLLALAGLCARRRR